MTSEELQRWVQQAKPGDSCVYWHRSHDCQKYPPVVDTAWALGNGGGTLTSPGLGFVALVQRRVENGFDYIAIRLKR